MNTLANPPKLRLELQPSYGYRHGLIALHVLSSALLIGLDTSFGWKITFLLGIGLSLVHQLNRWQTQSRYHLLVFHTENLEIFKHGSDIPIPALLHSYQIIQPNFCLLNLCDEQNKKICLLIFPDSCSTNELRQLRVLINCRGRDYYQSD